MRLIAFCLDIYLKFFFFLSLDYNMALFVRSVSSVHVLLAEFWNNEKWLNVCGIN